MDKKGNRVDKINFWNKKIIHWENARYFKKTIDLPWLEKLVNQASSSLQYRQKTAIKLLEPASNNRIILDAGCGSGLILQALAHTKAEKFIGIDFSGVAVENAKKISENYGYRDRADFILGDITSITLPHFDIFVALGLFDWLSLEQILQLLPKIKGKVFIISISEKQLSFKQILHKLYVWISYSRKNNGYKPIYYSVDEIIFALKQCGFDKINVIRDRRLSFSVILHNLPLTD